MQIKKKNIWQRWTLIDCSQIDLFISGYCTIENEEMCGISDIIY